MVSSGGEEVISGGGVASATMINSGGIEFVSSGGAALATTINGGLMEVASGGSTGNTATQAVTFTSAGGDLQLDASQSFNGLIAGFGSPSGVTEEIDPRDMPFQNSTHSTFHEAANLLSGTLTIKDRTQIATLTLLGQYSAAAFTLASDGHGGTMITDPTLSASTPASDGHGGTITNPTLTASTPASDGHGGTMITDPTLTASTPSTFLTVHHT